MNMKRFILAGVMALSAALATAAVNINTATAQELDTLPGIGPAKAQAIVEYRTQHGPFKSVDELDKVKGFGPALLEKIKPEITVQGKAVKQPTQSSPVKVK